MTLITHRDEIPAGARAVRHTCGATYAVDEVENDGADKLLCWPCEDAEAGTGYGFVVVRRVDLPPALSKAGFSKVPDAIWDHGAALSLTANERVLILALWRFQRGRAVAYPPVDLLMERTGLGDATVRRTVKALEARRLLKVRRGVHRGGQRLANEYDIAPLWTALAVIVERGGEPACDDVEGDTCRSERPVAGDQSDRQLAVGATAQVELEQVEPEQVEPPAAGHAGRGIDEDVIDGEVIEGTALTYVDPELASRLRLVQAGLAAGALSPEARAYAERLRLRVELRRAAA